MNSNPKSSQTALRSVLAMIPIVLFCEFSLLVSPVFAGEGHDAGYEWAERKGISDPDDCGGNSSSFIEGCQEYAEEQAKAERADDQDEESESEE